MFDFRERGKHEWVASLTRPCPLGIEPTTWVCGLTGEGICSLFLCTGTVLQPTEPHPTMAREKAIFAQFRAGAHDHWTETVTLSS